jgi:nicotinate-nucleotide adenylyltransferase
MQKIGILGGSFNPIHLGHLIIAQNALEELHLDKVIFIPTNITPLKTRSALIDPRHRLNMIKLAIKGNKGFAVSDIEIRRGGISYTIDTLSLLKKKYPYAKLFLIIGSDSLKILKKWKDLKGIQKLCRIVLARRTGSKITKGLSYQILTNPLIDISSMEIRRRVYLGLSLKYLVPDSVKRYIKKKRLYL